MFTIAQVLRSLVPSDFSTYRHAARLQTLGKAQVIGGQGGVDNRLELRPPHLHAVRNAACSHGVLRCIGLVVL